MAELNFTEAFAKYGATLKNPMWAFSAIADDGALVISCWQHKFSRPDKSTLRYKDRLSRWRGNVSGKNLLISHITEAFSKHLAVRLIVASTPETGVVDAGDDARDIPKTFHVREDLVGEVTSFDRDEYVIDFRKRTPV